MTFPRFRRPVLSPFLIKMEVMLVEGHSMKHAEHY